MTAALTGLKVLDLSMNVGGDYCARLLSDFGANVVKVEPPEGSPVRALGPFECNSDPNGSLLFWHNNAGKRSLVLNTDQTAGMEILKKLAQEVDVIVSTGELSALELGAERAGVVFAELQGFGDGGPMSEWTASEMILQAVGGSMYATGEPGREPIYGVGYRAHYMAGTYLYLATLAALFGRQDDRFIRVDTSILESVVAALCCFTTMYEYNGHISDRAGTGTPRALLQCNDGWVMLYIYERWAELCDLIGAQELKTDARFATKEKRYANWDAARNELQRHFLKQGSRELVQRAQEQRIAMTRVESPDDVLNSPHLDEREYWTSVEVRGKARKFPGAPFRLQKTPRDQLAPPPSLGEHSREVLAELGVNGSYIDSLVRQGVSV